MLVPGAENIILNEVKTYMINKFILKKNDVWCFCQ